jgi:hypothetical protein
VWLVARPLRNSQLIRHMTMLVNLRSRREERTSGPRFSYLPNYVPFLGGLVFLLLKLAQMGICRNHLPVTDETMH